MPALAQPPSDGLIGHWAFDDADGSNSAADSSGHRNPAQCGPAVAPNSGLKQTGNCPSFAVPGKFGTAADFLGIGNFLVVKNTMPASFTVSAWIKTTDSGTGKAGDPAYQGTGVIWSDKSGVAADMIPMALEGGHLAFGTGDCKSNNYDNLVSTAAVNTGKWVFAVATRNGATGEKRLYIDGKLDVSHENTGTCVLNANAIVVFGGNPLDGRYFTGALDDIRFYDRALSDDEILALTTPPAVKMATQTQPNPAATPASGGDSFAGTWQADMTTVPPQQPPLKSQAFAFTKTADGYTTKQTSVQQTKGGGTSSMWIDSKVVLDGKPHQGAMGETHTCNRADANTIHCTVAMGPNSFEEIYALSDGGKTFSDTMKGKDEKGNEQTMTTAYRGHVAAPPSSAVPAGPQRIVTHNGECEVTVPAEWMADPSTRAASSPDMAVDLHVFTTGYADNMKTLADLKALNANAYKPVKTFEDTPKRIWYQYAPHYQNDNGWYVAVLGKSGTCNLDMSFRNSVIPDAKAAKQIALSLRSAP